MSSDATRKLAAIWQHSGDALVLIDIKTHKILEANPRAETMFGYSGDQFRTLIIDDLHPYNISQEVVPVLLCCDIEAAARLDLTIIRSDGARLPAEVNTGRFIGGNNKTIVIACYRDNSEMVRAESGVRRLNWALSAVNRAALAIATAETESDMMRLLCEALTGDVFVLSWIGQANEADGQSVYVAAKGGTALGYLDGLEVSWGDIPYGRGPTGRAIKDAKTQVSNDAQSNADFSPWADRAMEFNINSSMAIPLIFDSSVTLALSVYSSQVNAFTPDVVRLFEDLARELVVGINAKRITVAYHNEAKKYHEETLRYKGVLEQTIAALATTIAKRDPYTAEHQRRVADYAVDVAVKLGWDLDRSESVYLAGLVHDIGKITVPSEILNKPGKLLPIEFELVKLHAMTGFDILSSIDFPWRLAEITRQHHERLDGSGYPDGLKGDEILLESQVVAVADIFEAMLSHRPYRPALGREAAITELRRLREGLLDPEIVDVAIEVFQR